MWCTKIIFHNNPNKQKTDQIALTSTKKGVAKKTITSTHCLAATIPKKTINNWVKKTVVGAKTSEKKIVKVINKDFNKAKSSVKKNKQKVVNLIKKDLGKIEKAATGDLSPPTPLRSLNLPLLAAFASKAAYTARTYYFPPN